MSPDWLPPDLIRAAGWTLVHFLWQGAFIAGLLALALRASAKAQTRHDLSFLALIAMAAAPVATFLVIRADAPLMVVVPADPGEGQALASWHAAVVGLWAAGVAILAARMAGGLWLVEKLRRESIALSDAWLERCRDLHARLPTVLPVAFRQSRQIAGPMVVGWLRPVVLIPASAFLRLPAEQLEAVILHELAHVRRLDAFANLFQGVVETLLFYHPAVWWVGRRIRIEREHCCDDLAVAVSGDVASFVRALMSIDQPSFSPDMALAAGGGSIRDRAARLLRLEEDAARPALPRLAALVLLMAALGLSIYGARVEASPDPTVPVAPRPQPVTRLGPVTSALNAETIIVAARPSPTSAPAPAEFSVVPQPLPPAPEIRERAPWVSPSAEATRRIATLDRMIASNREILDSSRELLAASKAALASPSAPMTEIERADHQVNIDWLPGAIDLADRLLGLRLENRAAVVQAESARQDLIAGRAFRADVARTDAYWAEMDKKTLALANERLGYLMRMADARKAATGEDVGSAARASLMAGGALRLAAGETREAGAAYAEARQQAEDGTLAPEAVGQAADALRGAQRALVNRVEGAAAASNGFESDLVRRYRERAARAQPPTSPADAAIEPQPAAR